MKNKKYEKKSFITASFILLVFIEIIEVIILFKSKVYKYYSIRGIVIQNNIVQLIITKKEQSILQSNKKVYINNKLLKYEILENKGMILKRDNKKYDEVIIKIHPSLKNKINDIIEINIKNSKESVIKRLLRIEEGG